MFIFYNILLTLDYLYYLKVSFCINVKCFIEERTDDLCPAAPAKNPLLLFRTARITFIHKSVLHLFVHAWKVLSVQHTHRTSANITVRNIWIYENNCASCIWVIKFNLFAVVLLIWGTELFHPQKVQGRMDWKDFSAKNHLNKLDKAIRPMSYYWNLSQTIRQKVRVQEFSTVLTFVDEMSVVLKCYWAPDILRFRH